MHKEWQYQKGIAIFFYRPLTDTRTRIRLTSYPTI